VFSISLPLQEKPKTQAKAAAVKFAVYSWHNNNDDDDNSNNNRSDTTTSQQCEPKEAFFNLFLITCEISSLLMSFQLIV